jgi:hypothetical protein
MVHEHRVLDTLGYRHTLRIRNTYCSKSTMVTRTRLTFMLHVHCLSCWMLNLVVHTLTIFPPTRLLIPLAWTNYTLPVRKTVSWMWTLGLETCRRYYKYKNVSLTKLCFVGLYYMDNQWLRRGTDSSLLKWYVLVSVTRQDTVWPQDIIVDINMFWKYPRRYNCRQA